MTRLLPLATLTLLPLLPAAAFEPQNLAGRPVTVRLNVEIEGNARVPANPLVDDSKVATLPIAANVELQYEERSLYPGSSGGIGPAPAVQRYFEKASSANRVNRSRQTLTLRPETVSMVSHRQTLPETTCVPGQPLHRDELELVAMPIASVDLDLLVDDDLKTGGPETAVENQAAASVLNLSSIDRNDLKIRCVEASGGKTKYELTGKVTGHVDGVPTTVRVIGKLTAEKTAGCVTWAAMAIHETRDAGVAEPGYDAKFTVRCTRTPTGQVRRLTKRISPDALQTPTDEDLLVEFASQSVGVSAMADRRWRVMRDVAGELMLRMVDADQSIAQCRILPLTPLPSGSTLSLPEFKTNVRKQLGDQFSSFTEQSTDTTATGLQTLRVVAAGNVSGVPIRWIMMHVADDEGRRISATWTMAADRAEQLAGTDVQMVQTMTLRDRDAATGDDAGGLAKFVPADSTKDAAGRLESWTAASQEVAEIASASDQSNKR